MKRLFPAIALAAAWAWGCGGGGEIPTVELGGVSGARLMNAPGRTPSETYDNAYAQLTRAHYNVHRNLDSRGQNQLGAREAVAQIVRSLQSMKACVAADASAYDPYISRYAGWQKDLETGSWGGAFLTDLERTEREVKSKFNPGAVKILEAFPGAPKPEHAPAKSNEPTFTADRVEVPVLSQPTADGPREPAADTPTVNPATTLRVLFKAWSTAHDELIAAYKAKQDCKAKYADVVASLKLFKEQHKGEKAATLQIYLDYYGGVDEKTKTFTALPEKTSEKDIVDELDVAARVIRKKFAPE